MANYKQTTVTGDVQDYQRANKVVIANELNAVPEITFLEQIITTLPDGRKITTGKDKCGATLADPAETFNLLNPETDAVIGSANYLEVYILLYSLYRHVADKRDADVAAAAVDQPQG